VFGLLIILIVLLVYVRTRRSEPSAATAGSQAAVGCRFVSDDFSSHRSGVWVVLGARVQRLLPDSVGQYRHQRFLVRCPAGQTVLVVNDVSLGERVPVRVGDEVGIRGEYVWNFRGGLVHFTHHDPGGGQGGWILRNGHVYSDPAPWTNLRTKTWITA
jgi:hypothetical protein